MIVGSTVVVFVVEMIRRPSRWLPVFLVAVVIGQTLMSTQIKDLLDRVRPTANPIAHTLGPSFPSGHTTGAAACFAAFALVLGRGRSRNTQAVLAGAAVFIAIAVAASRVLLGVHWLTDVLGGLALGWGWFALCSIAFGGRLLRLGAPVEAADARQRGSSENVGVRVTGSSASSLTVTVGAERRAVAGNGGDDGHVGEQHDDRPPVAVDDGGREDRGRSSACQHRRLDRVDARPVDRTGVSIGSWHHLDERGQARRPPTPAARPRRRPRARPRWRSDRRGGAAAR